MLYLKRNVPVLERTLRLGFALCLAVVTFSLSASGWIPWIAYVSAATLAITAVLGFCPACALLGRKPLASQR